MINFLIDLLSHHAAMIGLLFFFVFFCVVGFWTFRPSARKDYQKYARIPLKENK